MHELDFSRGRAAIAYVGETPWHGLGKQKEKGQSLESWIKDAELMWQLRMLPSLYDVSSDPAAPDIRTYGNRFALVRSDTGAALGHVSGSHFKPVQPRDVIMFYKDLCEHYGYELETAGSLKGGARVWALARVGKTFRAGKNDKLETYLLFVTGMDGKFSTTVKLTAIRVVCNNTLTMAVPEARKGANSSMKDITNGIIRVRHSSDFDETAVKTDLGLLPAQVKKYEGIVQTLAQTHISEAEATSLFQSLLLKKDLEATDASVEKIQDRVNDLMLAYHKGPGSELATANGTLWGAVNAVSYLTDHVLGRGADSRLNRAWFGSNERLKQRAMGLAMQHANILPTIKVA